MKLITYLACCLVMIAVNMMNSPFGVHVLFLVLSYVISRSASELRIELLHAYCNAIISGSLAGWLIGGLSFYIKVLVLELLTYVTAGQATVTFYQQINLLLGVLAFAFVLWQMKGDLLATFNEIKKSA